MPQFDTDRGDDAPPLGGKWTFDPTERGRGRGMVVDVTPALVDEQTPLLAHLMLGSITVVTGALDTIDGARGRLDEPTMDSLLAMAARQASKLAEALTAMARGHTADAIGLLAPSALARL
jgi:hypothetical protein